MMTTRAFSSPNSSRPRCVHARSRAPGSIEAATDPGRRAGLLLLCAAALTADGVTVEPASAGILTKARPKKVPESEYSTLENGLKYFDLEEGSGSAEVSPGDKVTVHFDCYYGVVDVVSSRYATLLGKNEIIPEPFEFTAGRPIVDRKVKTSDSGLAGGSFSGFGGPKPPKALSTSVFGMKAGGKRSVIVSPEQGYGEKGFEEIPAGADFKLMIEVLSLG